jgi:fatty acid synthase subunit alpha, fungi type
LGCFRASPSTFRVQAFYRFAPIHEIVDGRNERIKQFYWNLWYRDDEVLPTIDIRDKFTGPEVIIEAEAVETFCAVVGNQSESFKAVRRSDATVPMDFAIITGWQVSHLFRSLFRNLF